MSDDADQDSCPACTTWWRLPVALAAVLAAILLFANRQNEVPRNAATPAVSPSRLAEEPLRVSITIDFGDNKVLSNRVPWLAGMTVRDLLSSASLAGFGEKGRGESAFLVSIDDVQNEGAGGRNWTYQVNGKHADRSYAVYELQPNDQVLWTFAAPK
jgi:hypothetical protein